MTMLSLEEAQARLPELIRKLTPGEELVITKNNEPVAKVVAMRAERPRPVLGRAKGMLTVLAEDDEHLEDFREYLP